ncbi:type II toxin-antitoxin system antitoxin SocA domain-containing protein [Flavobacterium seoulense]|uniref:Antitoxin SocA-like Panacea domain-containing protein n=1 Tax=Flavobacterium seoulense TaxID=1492738 RepID=A0A066WRL3_9FLAO|nr:type II toxin-antitoxin system antitoxin SocA domain-containing protein [Flavobacterium seoulense]KDN56707.1 hypothetical protein FEM21_02100 [Flavobacterium seoulense]
MNKSEKIKAFEYLVFKLIIWNKELNNGNENNDISVLKALKLLFFVSAVGTTKNSEDTLLDNAFNNFVAMPYGHVESDIYFAIKKNHLQFISIDNSKTSVNSTFKESDLDFDLKHKIDKSVDTLKEINKNLIKMNAFDLVELSHSWYSWRYFFAKAQKNNTLSEAIPTEIIKAEEKNFFLNN